MNPNYSWPSYRSGVLVDFPDNFHMEKIDWDKEVIGKFYGDNPPSFLMVQRIVDTRWLKRDNITVHKTGLFFVFVCSHLRDIEALLEQRTSVIDGRIVSFLRGSRGTILPDLDFESAQLWIRIVGLPLGMLYPEWALECLRHVGNVDYFHVEGHGLPPEPEFRACVTLNLEKPLIPGCYVPTGDGQVENIKDGGQGEVDDNGGGGGNNNGGGNVGDDGGEGDGNGGGNNAGTYQNWFIPNVGGCLDESENVNSNKSSGNGGGNISNGYINNTNNGKDDNAKDEVLGSDFFATTSQSSIEKVRWRKFEAITM
ncbi:uncharacterized protein [Spinacia oleracea]|uniref:DUF4283 domain-containing protein n=1 Tax=Spinacia oleracea TaxID=3562 RepID=A0ABM3QVB9_SPIOL|nr:uncharacterized protein LOC130462635 [Spinacia oleracea]